MTQLNQLPEIIQPNDEGHIDDHVVVHVAVKNHENRMRSSEYNIAFLQDDVADIVEELGTKSDNGHTHGWGSIENKPASFRPESHRHEWSEINSKPSAYTPAPHDHNVTDINASGTPSTITFLRGDGTWSIPSGNDYGSMSEAQANAGTSTTGMVVSPQRLRGAVQYHTSSKVERQEFTSELSKKADLVNGTIPTAQIPSLALTRPFPVANRAAMLQLVAQEGDLAIITAGADKGTYILGAGSSTSFASWIPLVHPGGGGIDSVNGQVGSVVLSASDVGARSSTWVPSWGEVAGKPATFNPSAHVHPVADINATGTRSASTYLRGDGTWTAPANTTYAVMTAAEANAGSAATARTVSAVRLKQTIEHHTSSKASQSDLDQVALSMGRNNVKDFGAIGNGVANDTVAVQEAIDSLTSAGGTVYFPPGTYRITDAIRLRDALKLEGANSSASVVQQVTANRHGFAGTDISTLSVHGLQINGPGKTSGNGTAIHLDRDKNTATNYLSLRDVSLQSFGRDGLYASNAIVSHIDSVTAEQCGGAGFNLTGLNGSFGASTHLSNCFANACGTGYKVDTMGYTSFTACAADNNNISYDVINGVGVTFNGSGSEGSGTHAWRFTGGYGSTITGGWVYGQKGIGIHVTGGAVGITAIGISETAPHTTATTFMKVDQGATATVMNVRNTKPNDFAPGTTQVVNDVVGNTSLNGTLSVKDGLTVGGSEIQPSGRFFVAGSPYAGHTNVPSPVRGDTFIYPVSGEVFTHNGGSWSVAGSIMTGTSHTHTKAQVGLSNVDNTSDAAKPVSTATQAAINAKIQLVTDFPTSPVAGVLYLKEE